MSYSYTFKWPKGPKEVILTGSMDNWCKSLFLVKESDGSFALTVPLGPERILYKYVVDGEWMVSHDEKTIKDEEGNENNVLEISDLVDIKSSGVPIPESGGLPVAAAANGVSTTVMPSTEGQQVSLAGEPGIVIPKDDEQLKAFGEVRDVDAKALNEKIEAEEKKKQKKKVKRSQYKAKRKQKKAEGAAIAAASAADSSASGTARDTTEAETEVENTPEPQSDAEAYVAEATGVEKDSTTKEIEQEIAKDKEEDAAIAAATADEIPIASEEHLTLDPKAQATAADTQVAQPEITQPEVTQPEVTQPEVTQPEVTQPEVTQPGVKEVSTPAQVEPLEGVKQESEVIPDTSKPGAEASNFESDDEIVVAQGQENGQSIEDAIRAQESEDVIIEEIQPSESEKARLTQDANIHPVSPSKAQEKPSAKAKTVPASSSSKKTSPPAKVEEKKKSSFFSKIKKIFK